MTELQILQIDQDLRSEASKDLAEIRSKILELVERKFAAEDQLKRIDIRAPVAAIGPRAAVQLMSAFCRSCATGLSALPEKLGGVAPHRRRLHWPGRTDHADCAC